jgi:hypothetical protein
MQSRFAALKVFPRFSPNAFRISLLRRGGEIVGGLTRQQRKALEVICCRSLRALHLTGLVFIAEDKSRHIWTPAIVGS